MTVLQAESAGVAVGWAVSVSTGHGSADRVLAEMARLARLRRDGRWTFRSKRSRFLPAAGGDDRDLSWTVWALGEFRLVRSTGEPEGVETWTLNVGAMPDVANFLGYEPNRPAAAGSPKRRTRPKIHPNTLKRVRLAVYQRDGFRCRLCGWSPPVPDSYDGRYALGASDDRPGRPRYAVRLLELDHIFPFKLGGRFEIDNLQTLCNSCNARKGARV